MALKLSNNAVSKLAAGITAAATSISVMPGDGAKFPALAAGDWFPATLFVAATGALEIVKVTARATDTLTVVRAQEGTAAQAFNAGDGIELRWTSAAANTFAPLDSPAFTGSASFSTRPSFNGNTPWDSGNMAIPSTAFVTGGDESDLPVNTASTRLTSNVVAGKGGVIMAFATLSFFYAGGGAAANGIARVQIIDTTNSAVVASSQQSVGYCSSVVTRTNLNAMISAGALVEGRTYQIQLQTWKDQAQGPMYPQFMSINSIKF